MKKIITALLMVVSASIFSYNATAAETTKVCVDVKDKAGNVVKDSKGVVKQNCKTMKVHKKLEGTKVPEKK